MLLLVAAVLLGYLTDIALTEFDRFLYPTDFSELVEEYAAQYDLEPCIVYALIKELSNFSSNRVSPDGKIGLMQLSEETFLWLTQDHLGENLNVGLLYDPATNIKYGCYYLLYLTTRYESWDAVYAAYLYGPETVDIRYGEWLAEPAQTRGEFRISSEEIQKEINKIQRAVDKYQKLYHKKGDAVS